MGGLAKNKRCKTMGTTDDSLPTLDLPRCVIAFVPGDDGYDEMMELPMSEYIRILNNELYQQC